VLDRLNDVPVLVVDAAWQPIAKNALAKALLGDGDGNVLRRHFSGETGRVVREPEEAARMEERAVADLHAAAGRFPDDEPLQS